MKHVVFGAGLIGGYLGGVLTSLGHDTTLVCRPVIKAKLSNGLCLTDYQEHRVEVPQLQIIDSSKATSPIHDVDYLWITVKCTAIESIIENIRPYICPRTVIFCCQNGLGSDEPIQSNYPNNTVLRVMFPFNVVERSAGHLHRGSEGDVYIENNNLDAVNTLLPKLQSPLMTVKQTADMDSVLWAKLQLNLANSVNALAYIPVLDMLMQRSYRLVIATLSKELLAVTKVANIRLPKLTTLPAQFIPYILQLPTPIYKIVTKKVLNIDPTVRTSMWWDLSQGKKTEIDHLNGAVVRMGKKLNVPCPANTKIIQLIKNNEGLGSRRVSYTGKDLLKYIST